MEHDTAPRWERRKASRPDEILDAALPLFVERGYAATKIEHIAQAAGVTKGTPYLYFENKAEIFKSVVRRGLVPLTHSCEALALDRSRPARERLFGAVRLWVEAVDCAGGGGLVRLDGEQALCLSSTTTDSQIYLPLLSANESGIAEQQLKLEICLCFNGMFGI